MRRCFTIIPRWRVGLAALATVCLMIGCSGDPKKDAYKGQDKPVPEDKKDKDK